MSSLRRTTLIWMTLLLTLVGTAAALIAYGFETNEASEFLDGQQRQIALNAGEGLRKDMAPSADQDHEDEFSVTIWNADGHIIHATMPEVEIPRQSKQGFSDISVGGQSWRVYMATDGFKTIQVAQRGLWGRSTSADRHSTLVDCCRLGHEPNAWTAGHARTRAC